MKYLLGSVVMLVSLSAAAETNKQENKMLELFKAANYVLSLDGVNRTVLYQCGKSFADLNKTTTQARVKWQLRNSVYVKKQQKIMKEFFAYAEKREGAQKTRKMEANMYALQKKKAGELGESIKKSEPEKRRQTCDAFIKVINDGKMDIKIKSPAAAAVLDNYK